MRDGTLGIWVVRKEAEELGRYLEVKLGGHLGGLGCGGRETNRDAFASRCASYRQWVLVMATGIAVRYLAGLIKDKRSDPGVVVIDEGCRFAVSLLGGHEGGGEFFGFTASRTSLELCRSSPLLPKRSSRLSSGLGAAKVFELIISMQRCARPC